MESWSTRCLRAPIPLRSTPLLLVSRSRRPPQASRGRPRHGGSVSRASSRHALLLPATASRGYAVLAANHSAQIMTTTVELATVPSADTPGTSVYVHHDLRSYIFGRVAEGTQRAFGSRKIHYSGTEHVFLTGPVGWEQMGGLVGYLLSLGGAFDSAKDNLEEENMRRKQKGLRLLRNSMSSAIGIHGGDNLSHIMAACRSVILRQTIAVRLHEHRTDPRAAHEANTTPDWQDECIRVWKVPVRRARSSSPPKRPHSSVEDDGAEAEPVSSCYKSPSTMSDPDVAAWIVEKAMFNGKLNNNSSLPSRKLRDLQPTDAAFTLEQGVPKAYKGPYAADGAQLPNPDERAWVFQEPNGSPDKESTAGSDDDERPLHVTQFPLPRTCYSETAMSYIVKCHDRRGKFNAPAAVELGVKPPDFKVLAAGQTAQGKDGMTVTPDMVLGDPLPGKGIVVADIPSQDFMDAFMERPEWRSTELIKDIAVMYWILGPGMAGDARVQAFTQKHPQTKHVFCAEDTCPDMVTHPGAAEVQVKLRQIDPQRYLLASFDNTVKHPAPPPGSPVELGRAGKKLQLMPRLVFDDQAMAPFPDLTRASTEADQRILRMADKAWFEASSPALLARIEATERDIPNRDAEIVALGTGSSMPSQHRNVSSTLVLVPGIGNYLLDCGEGTLGQMRRAFGADKTAAVLRGLRCIVISHLHGDHHLGTASVIKAWYEQTLRDGSAATLAVSCIGRFRSMLEELAQVEDMGFHRLRFPSCPEAGGGREREVTTRADLGADDFGLASIQRVAVPHCWRSYGTQLELTSGLRIVYSGDCRPSPALVDAFRGAHLLVHECTFGNDMADHARAKKHCTMAEALGVARDMGARRTLLTHFSQRYAKADCLRRLSNAAGPGDQCVLLALDLMRVRLGEFQRAACFVPAVQKLMERLTYDPKEGA